MKRLAAAVILIFCCAIAAHAQAPQNNFGGRTDVPAPLIHPDRVAGSCSQTTGANNQLCTPSNITSVTEYYTNGQSGTNLIEDWTVCVNSGTLCFPVGVNMPMCIDGTGTNQDNGGLDWDYETTDEDKGASHLVSINTALNTPNPGPVGQMTLNPYNTSNTVSSTSAYIRPCMGSVQNVHTPYGTGQQFVDPDGDWDWLIAASSANAAGIYQSNIEKKYGSLCAAWKYLEIDMKDSYWGGFGEDVDNITWLPTSEGSCSGGSNPYFDAPPVLGGLTLQALTSDPMQNRFGAASEPMINLEAAIDYSISGGEVHAMGDYASPYFGDPTQGYVFNYFPGLCCGHPWGSTVSYHAYRSPIFFAYQSDDTDYNNVVDSNGLMPYNPLQATSYEPGLVGFTAPIHVTFMSNVVSLAGEQPPFIYQDDRVWSKQPGSVPSGCYAPYSFTSGYTGGNFGTSYGYCSAPVFAAVFYGNNIGNLNSAWGTNYYSFGTTETVVPIGAPSSCSPSCSGNGVATVFTFNLNANVTPSSVHIFMAPSGKTEQMVAGDCPYISSKDCASLSFAGESVAQGVLENGNTIAASTYYPAPTSSSAEFCDPDTNNYMECEDGSSAATTPSSPTWSTTVGATSTNGQTWTNYDSALISPWAKSTVYPVLASGYCIIDSNFNRQCETAGGTSGTSAPTWNTSGTTSDGSVTWTESGASAQTSINYKTGAVTLAFANPLASGTAIETSYTTGGWGVNKTGGVEGIAGQNGLADEDGDSPSGVSSFTGLNVFGTIPEEMYQPLAWQNSQTYGSYYDYFPNPGIICDGRDSCSGTGTTDLWIMQVNPAGCTSRASNPQPNFSATPGTVFKDTDNCWWATIGPPNAGTGGQYSAPNAVAPAGILLMLWDYEFSYSYYHPLLSLLADMFPGTVIMQPNATMNAPRREPLQVAYQQGMAAEAMNGGYLKTAVDSNFANSVTDPLAWIKLAAYEHYFPGAIYDETYYEIEQNPTGVCAQTTHENCYDTLAHWSQAWYNHVNAALNSVTNTSPLGISSFNIAALGEWAPFNPDQGNSSSVIKDLADNRMDGTEDGLTAVNCGNGFGTNACGANEPGASSGINAGWASPYDYNDWTGPTGMAAANEQWLFNPPSTLGKPAGRPITIWSKLTLIAPSDGPGFGRIHLPDASHGLLEQLRK